MKFDFSLEPVLKVRRHEEKIQKQKLAEKLTEKKVIAEQEAKLQEKLKNMIERGDVENFKNLHDLKRHRSCLDELHQEVRKMKGSLKAIETAINKQRDKLTAVHKKRHMIEKIKEEEYELFLEEVSRQERKIMDEIATQGYSQ